MPSHPPPPTCFSQVNVLLRVVLVFGQLQSLATGHKQLDRAVFSAGRLLDELREATQSRVAVNVNAVRETTVRERQQSHS